MIQENDIFAERYQLIKLIGCGGFAEVWRAIDMKANIEVALKIYAPGSGVDEVGIQIFMQEFALVFNINHQNLLRPSHFDEYNRKPYLVLPFCSNGSSAKLVGTISEEGVWRLLRDVANGLAYLHDQEPPIIHQDIKPDNILMDEKGNFLISDFGISTKIRSTLRKSVEGKSSPGTIAYMAPERFSQNRKAIKASDIWSVGAMLYELMSYDLPFGENGGLLQMNGAMIPNVEEDFSADLKRVTLACLSKEPWDRPTASVLADYATGWLAGKRVPFDFKTSEHKDEGKGQGTGRKTVQQNNPFSSQPLAEENNRETEKKKVNVKSIFIGVVVVVVLFGSIFIKNILDNKRIKREREAAHIEQIRQDDLKKAEAARLAKIRQDSIDLANKEIYVDVLSVEMVEVTYVLYPNKTAKVRSAGIGDAVKVTIPSEVMYNNESYSVTSIGAYSFKRFDKLTNINLPNSITTIEEYAFFECSSLSSITIPEAVTFIGEGAFANCVKIRSLKLPNSVTTIENVAFGSCCSLTSITIPNTVTSIGSDVFLYCDDLHSIYVSSTSRVYNQLKNEYGSKVKTK